MGMCAWGLAPQPGDGLSLAHDEPRLAEPKTQSLYLQCLKKTSAAQEKADLSVLSC